MNERLAKLTEQCYEYNETMQGTWFNKTKFAELIVRECADVATINQYQHGIVGSYVKKYFGVE
jgi:hypothetical protein